MLKPHWLDEDEEDPEKPRLVKATGAADFLIEQYGHLAGHPVWMGIGVNGMYTDEKVLGYIKWALEKRAGTVWVVLAHENGALIKEITKQISIKYLLTGRINITTVQSLLNQLPHCGQAMHTFALLALLRNMLLQDEKFSEDTKTEADAEEVIQRLFLIYHLQRYGHIGLKLSPVADEKMDSVYTKFTRGEYNIQPHNTPRTPQGFIYLQ